MSQFLITEPLEATLAALADALDEADIGILLLDPDLRIRFCNRRLLAVFGLSTALLTRGITFREMLDLTMADSLIALPTDNLTAHHDEREAAVRAGAISPTHIDLKDGTRLLFACKACPDGGRILTYADVSRELRMEELYAMEQINADLRFNNETMAAHAAQLASLAEATDESARKVEDAKRALEREMVERRQLEARLREMATTDGLTGALNRSGFLGLSQNDLDHKPEPDRGMALMMLDVDHFKLINDRYGHAGGDRALKHLVTTLGTRMRRGDLLGRLGGEEFAILLPRIAPAEAERFAGRLVMHVAGSPVLHDGRSIQMTISIGLTMVKATDRSVEHVIARADAALYRAKESGRNRVVKDVAMQAA
ncbi:MAG TPA: diguanylate cyclase [Acetobacteraceae bacterium]|nr:diguanylate cyclase [Acetobacteraceae bacterium]